MAFPPLIRFPVHSAPKHTQCFSFPAVERNDKTSAGTTLIARYGDTEMDLCPLFNSSNRIPVLWIYGMKHVCQPFLLCVKQFSAHTCGGQVAHLRWARRASIGQARCSAVRGLCATCPALLPENNTGACSDCPAPPGLCFSTTPRRGPLRAGSACLRLLYHSFSTKQTILRQEG